MVQKPLNVEEYLHSLQPPFKAVLERLRAIILTNFPTITETIMHEGLWYESKFYLAKIQDHVNLGVGIKGLSKEDVKLFLGTGKTMRHLKFFTEQEIDEPKVVELLKIVWNKVICDENIQWHLEK
jgi:hypothetical protein